ncbi:hypothetical protein L1987_07912 [Smallanthus sonchifolius]|uniref:Uncharacterized protein n=1 Tax=Smallanthus sonchifolius TaxID=185202 RepID=A0ACB9JKY8_9ASTR|nr:hypothetical protein L1987_07912 [Smallanthus sonchifolius]
MPRRLKYSEIRSATKGFNRSHIIGEGVSAVVYKTDRNLVVKRFKTAAFGSQTVTEFATMSLSFETRLNVLIGVSSALLYLHEECEAYGGDSVGYVGESPEVVVKGGVDDVVTSWGTPTSHFSKV